MLKIKRDKFRRARGGNSRFFNIYCANCKEFLLLYQKDGLGPLKRLYLNRIFKPEDLAKLQEIGHIKYVTNLICSICQTVIGTSYVYEKENRNAILLNPRNFTKKLMK